MKVILLENIKGVGRMGDIKNVADGYGRNFLIAKGLAKVATEGTVKEAELLKKKAEAGEKIAHEKTKEVAEKAKDVVLEFTKKASKTGKLFASVTKEEIAEELSKAVGGKIEADMINLNPSAGSGQVHGEYIKQEGEHMIEVELAPGIKVELKVVVKG
ncbi:MAG: 50S ribosomal protein L9 [bacterium]|nr:50S ribosomal protein L9 [bacterium]